MGAILFREGACFCLIAVDDGYQIDVWMGGQVLGMEGPEIARADKGSAYW